MACDALLVIAGTRDLGHLRRARKRGVRVVHRLDGINWLHRKHRTPLRVSIRAETGNLLLAFIRRFCRRPDGLPERVHPALVGGLVRAGPGAVSVIHNGIDLERYSPSGPGERPRTWSASLVVEGSLTHGHESRVVLGGVSGGEAQGASASADGVSDCGGGC